MQKHISPHVRCFSISSPVALTLNKFLNGRFSKKFVQCFTCGLGRGIEPGTAGPEVQLLPLFFAVPSNYDLNFN